MFDDAKQIHSVLGAVLALHNGLSHRIEQSLRRLETLKLCDYRPAFLPEQGKPPREAIITWASGFLKAMSLAPTDWSSLIEDERTQVLVIPFIGFMDPVQNTEFEPALDIEERLDDAAEAIPRAILLLRKIAEIRARRTTPAAATPTSKIGRNEPCPCGSGKKYKRCCART